MAGGAKLRVLVVDDSAMNRRALGDVLDAIIGVEVVGKASDGDEALRLAVALRPDLITLDLEMPRMDGFTFLRLLMASRPTAVIVISGHAAKDNVFRALELGAIDFITKPQESLAGNLTAVKQQLEQMVEMVRHLSPSSFEGAKLAPQRVGHTPAGGRPVPGAQPVAAGATAVPRTAERPVRKPVAGPPKRLVVIASSTGGPTALLEVFARLPADASAAVIVAQHMPERFTRTFAERLDRLSAFDVQEAADEHVLTGGMGLVCPGGRSVEVHLVDGKMIARVVRPVESDRYSPSADRLFSTAAAAAGERVIGVVLTGMGDDGARGVAAINKVGGVVLVEAEETAVVYGMPRAAQGAGRVDFILPLRDLAERLTELIA
jgi:two-component system chemotaxis response regulator CheB